MLFKGQLCCSVGCRAPVVPKKDLENSLTLYYVHYTFNRKRNFKLFSSREKENPY